MRDCSLFRRSLLPESTVLGTYNFGEHVAQTSNDEVDEQKKIDISYSHLCARPSQWDQSSLKSHLKPNYCVNRVK